MKITAHELSQMSIAELSNLNSLVVSVIKAKRGLEGQQKAQNLRIDQEVKINHKDYTDTVFLVKKINRTKALLAIKGGFAEYNVPFNMIITDLEK